MFTVFLLIHVGISQSTTYYVTVDGTDSETCGSQSAPCGTINQILTNYPGQSYTVSIGSGNYTPTAISLQNDAVVVFQGAGNPVITPTWNRVFISGSDTSGFEFHDLTIVFLGNGASFTSSSSGNNKAGFYNVVLIYSGYDGDFADVNGGSLIISNVTVNHASFNSKFILAQSAQNDTSITISKSTFTNLTIGEEGGLLVIDAYGAVSIDIDKSIFDTITTGYAFIAFWAEDRNQHVSITNNYIWNINTYLPSVYGENDYQSSFYLRNTTFINVTAEFAAGAVELLGSDDGVDHNITFDNTPILNCTGQYAGGILVAFNTLYITSINFVGNYGGYGNDVVQGVDAATTSFEYNILNSTSKSSQPKAVVWNTDSDNLDDISYLLPSPRCDPCTIAPLKRADISHAPKFGRKPRKYN